MIRRLYKKENAIEVIIESPAECFDRVKLEKNIVDIYGRFEKWKNLIEIESGYTPVAEFECCSQFEMPKVVIEHSLSENIDGILKKDSAIRANRVDEWYFYYKFTLKKKNPLRNIESIFKSLSASLLPSEKDKVRDFLKGENDFMQI